jgi:hypothetical protein
MITDINRSTITDHIEKKALPEYWGQYFSYTKDIDLSGLTESEFLVVINEERGKARPYIDSQIVINNILTKLGNRHNFHRQFHERHGNLLKEQVLGMQLYYLMVEDKDLWVYCKTQGADHLFPHSTYFK